MTTDTAAAPERRTKKPTLPPGERARRIRVRLGYTVSYVAEQTGVGQGAISEYERGLRTNVKLDTVKRLCEFYGVTSRSLLDF